MEEDYIKFHEEERKRLAADIHDITVQNLVYLLHKLEVVSKYIDLDPIEAKLVVNVVKNSLKDTIKETRNLIFDLRPMIFDDLGFTSALIDFFNDFEFRYDIKFNYDIDHQIDVLPESFLIQIYRIIQEFCTNTVKHAGACNIYVNICYNENDNKLSLTLKDDGKGCELHNVKLNKHFGLHLIKERISALGGTYKFESSPNNGFVLYADIPLLR